MGKISFEGVVALKKSRFARRFEQYTLLVFSRVYTVRNVETKPALFRATTLSMRDFTHGYTRKFTIIFIFIVTLILHTCKASNTI